MEEILTVSTWDWVILDLVVWRSCTTLHKNNLYIKNIFRFTYQIK